MFFISIIKHSVIRGFINCRIYGPAVLGGYKEFQHGNRGGGTIKQDHRRMKYHCNLWNYQSLYFYLEILFNPLSSQKLPRNSQSWRTHSTWPAWLIRPTSPTRPINPTSLGPLDPQGKTQRAHQPNQTKHTRPTRSTIPTIPILRSPDRKAQQPYKGYIQQQQMKKKTFGGVPSAECLKNIWNHSLEFLEWNIWQNSTRFFFS